MAMLGIFPSEVGMIRGFPDCRSSTKMNESFFRWTAATSAGRQTVPKALAHPRSGFVFFLATTSRFTVLFTVLALGWRASAASCLPPPAGLVGWWPAEGNGNDIVGANNGALQGGATASGAGMVGSAFQFDGATGDVQIPDSPVFHPTNLTIEAWVNFSSLDSTGSGAPAGEQYIVFKQNSRSASFEGFYLGKTRISNQDHLTFQVTSAAGQNIEVDSATLIAAGVWYYVAGVRGSNFIQIYVNGQMESQAAVAFPQDYGTLPLYLGRSGQTSWDRRLAGRLDEVSLYNRALASNEIAAIYAAGAAGKCTGSSGLAITVEPQSQTAVIGTNNVFTVTATGAGPLVYQWLFDGVATPGATNSTLTLTNIQPADAGDYTVVVSNSSGAVTSSVATLTVLGPGPPVIIVQPASQSAVAGANLNFSVSVSGTMPMAYQWLFNGGILADADAQPTNAGSYWVVVSNVAGAVTSSVAALTLSVAGSCVSPPDGLIGWWPGDGNANDIARANNAILRGAATVNTAGRVGSAFHFDGTNDYVQIPDSPILRPTNVTVECWVNFDRMDSDGTNPQGNAYLVFKQNTRSSVFEGINLAKHRVPAGEIIVWEVSSAAGVPVQIDSVSLVTTGVWYHVVGVRGTNFTQLYINGQLESQGSVDFPQDYGNYPLYFGTSGEPYWDRRLAGSLDEVSLYNRALSATEIAALYAAGSAGKCKAPPVIVTQPQGGLQYWGSSITLTSSATGLGRLNYQWQKDGQAVLGGTNSSLILTNLQGADVGAYTVVVTNAIGSVTSVPALLTLKVADLSLSVLGTPTQGVAGVAIGGLTGQTYGIQSSDDLSIANNWRGQTNLTLTSPSQAWNDPQPMTLPQRYYRVVPGPIPIP